MRFSFPYWRRVSRVGFAACLLWGVGVVAQDRTAQESRREQWQKVQEIFAEMRVRPGATVADIGAGDGFFTSRLARAVGPNGRVFAVDIDDKAIGLLRKRLDDESIRNVTVIKGAVDDPQLPPGVLDSALIVNAYHEIDQHHAVLTALRAALKPEGRLVIVEPVRDSRRHRPRADQVRDHEIDPEYVLKEARAAGFRIVGLQDPFTTRDRHVEWLLALQTAESAPVTTPTVEPEADEPSAGELADPALRVSLEEFRALASAAAITIVDVRDRDSFAAGHIARAISIPLDSVASNVEQLRKLAKPIVTYCS